jgi:peptide-methionine (R)-S-oxide reductase
MTVCEALAMDDSYSSARHTAGSITHSRRRFLTRGLAAVAVLAGTRRLGAAPPSSAPQRSGMVTIENFSGAGVSQGTVELARLVKSDEEWRQLLSPSAFHVTRQSGTDFPFSGAYDKSYENGLYRCICCDTALFDSRTKFDSHTGWPSFWQAISRFNVAEASGSRMAMTGVPVACRRCEAHLGHVFDDGPPPTGLRYCINSVSLKFVRRA